MRLRTLTVPVGALALALAAPAAPAFAHGDAEDKVVFKDVVVADTVGTGKNMAPVANVAYDKVPNATRGMAGTDIEFARIGGRDYAFGGTYYNGLQIVDITDPTAPQKTAVYDCNILQGDVQVFPQGDRVLAVYTADSSFKAAGVASRCGQDLGIKSGQLGSVIIDVTNPADPQSLSFAEVPQGSHNMTVHPSGDYLYNSNSDLITSTTPNITIFDIKDPAAPRKVQDYRIPFVPASLGSESHDITFNADGSRAYSAALSQTLVLDTTDPENPKQVAQILDPTVQVSHGADPITLTGKDGKQREFLMISDEQAGAATGTNCPGGGVHIYEITGAMEKAPKKVGTWFIGESKPSTATCTAHVFRMHGDQGLFTIAWYDQGVRVVDVQGLVDRPASAVPFVTSGNGNGIREIGAYTFEDSNTWSFKTNTIAADGSFFGFGNDLGRGLDVYRFDGTALGRTVPVLEPQEMLQSEEPAAVAPGKSGDRRKDNRNKAAAVTPFSSGGGSFPTGVALLALGGMAVVGGNAVMVRRAGGRLATA